MIPQVVNQKTDHNLGVTSNTDRILAIIGCASAGAFDTPTALSNTNDVTTTFGDGPLVQAGVYLLTQGIPCVFIRSNPTTPGSFGTINSAGILGTATVVAGATAPDDTYDVIVQIVTGGALGTAGIVFRFSLDNGVSWSNPQALGTSLTLTCSEGVTFTLSTTASTLLAGDTWSVSTVAPEILTANLTSSFAALTSYSGEWLRVLVLADADSTLLAQGQAFATSFHAYGKYPEVVMNTRPRGAAESRPTYQTALAAIVAGIQTAEVSCCADQCEMVIGSQRLRRPVSLPFATRLMVNDDSQDAAAFADGALPETFTTTAAGLRNYHDERLYPGLDALGFTTLRTWGGRPIVPGAYINNARVLAGSTSDYQFFQLSAIVNRAIEMGFQLLQPRLSSAVLVNANGTINEDVASAIEDSCSSQLRKSFSDAKRCSGIQLKLSRTDDVLTTNTISYAIGLQPLGYIKMFFGKTGLVRTLPITA